MAKHSVTLSIAGQRLNIRSDKDEAYLTELASYLDGVIRDLNKGRRSTVATQQVYLLAALNVTDQLFAMRKNSESFKEEVRERTEVLVDLLGSLEFEDEPNSAL